MLKLLNTTFAMLVCLGLGLVRPAMATTDDAMQGALNIAHGIRIVQPNLSDAKYISYGIAIQRASKRYGIHPSILIAIAQQESGFRTNLPQGPAGEIGICQVLKRWLKNPQFIKEFGLLTVHDLNRPATSFKIAAWILADLRDSSLSGPLPYWTFYNSREFRNRLKYYVKVSRNVAALRAKAPAVYNEAVLVAASSPKTANSTVRRQVASEREHNAVKAAKLLFPKRLSQRKGAQVFLRTASLLGTSH